MPRTHSEIVKTNNQAQRTLAREKKAIKGKAKPIGPAANIANLFRRSEKKQRNAEYSKAKILAVGGAPYWPPLTKRVLELLKEKKGVVHNGFVFEVAKNSTEHRIIFKTQMKIGKNILTNTANYFEINMGQRTIRFAPEWKLLDKPNPTLEERQHLLGQKRI